MSRPNPVSPFAVACRKLQDSTRGFCTAPNSSKSGENKFANYKYFELADFLPATLNVDLLGGIALAPTTRGRPPKKRPQVTDRRVAARRLIVFGEMFADLFFRDLVDIDFRRKSVRKQSQKGLVTDDGLRRRATVL